MKEDIIGKRVERREYEKMETEKEMKEDTKGKEIKDRDRGERVVSVCSFFIRS
jgi:hypothetical protein